MDNEDRVVDTADHMGKMDSMDGGLNHLTG
jgi:hypothetical protein